MDLLPRFEDLKPLAPELESLRRKAAEHFAAKGLPTRKDEEWRYTSVKLLKDRSFTSSLVEAKAPSHETMKRIATDLDPRFFNVVFVNGVLDKTLSDLEDLPKELEWSETFVASADFADSFEALNAAWIGQGLTLRLRKNSSLEKPLRLHFHTHLDGPALMVNPRLRVEIGDGSSAVVLESYSGQESAGYFVNAHTEIATGASSKLIHVRLQEESLQAAHIARSRIRAGEQSEIVHLTMSTGALLSRHMLDMAFEKTGATAKLLGLAALAGEQHHDDTGQIDHKVGGCTSVQTYKNLLDGKSRSVFAGRIRIRQDAQKALSEQLNNNLLLSSSAEADSQPQLMIEADDVKAAHGSTVGQLNQDELFYLMSRGLSRKTAIPLLAAGFLAELIDLVENETLHGWLLGRLKTSLTRLHTEEA